MNKLLVLFGGIVACTGVWVAPVFAQDAASPVSAQPGSKPVLVATVNIRNAEMKGRVGDAVTIAFDVTNREGVQPKVIYAVNLLGKTEAGASFIADRMVYDDILTLGVGETVHREVMYRVPAYLKGAFTIKVEARNPEGLLFGMMPVPGEIVLSGAGEGIIIDPAACFLSVDGEAGDKRYTLSQGVDVSEAETLRAHCALKSAFASDKAIVPAIEVRHRSVFGKLVRTEKLDPIMLAAGQQAVDFSAEIMKPAEPQAYDAVLVFFDEHENRLSAPIDFHFVLQGGSATIQNVTLDKSSYQKGETAQVLFFWNAAADGFFGARTETLSGSKLTTEVSLADGDGNTCAETLRGSFDTTRRGGAERLSVPVTRDCRSVVMVSRISDENGKILAERTDAFSADTAQATPASPKAPGTGIDSRFVGALYAAIILLVGLLLVYLVRRHRRSGMVALFGLVAFSSMMLGSEKASADTWYAHNGDIVFTFGLDKDEYLAGEPIMASGDLYFGLCSNSHPELGLKATVNGTTKDFLSPTESFVAPSVSGTHLAVFDMSYFLWWYDTEEEKLTNQIETAAYAASVPYTVIAPSYTCTGTVPAHAALYPTDMLGLSADTAKTYSATDTAAKCEFSCDAGYLWDGSLCAAPADPALSFSADPVAIAYGGTATLSWSTTGATSCFAWGGGIDGWKLVNGSQSVLPVSTTAYAMECWNAIGVSSGQQDAVVTVSPPAAPIADLKVNGSDGPITIAQGATKTLSWTSTSATSCTASSSDGFAGLKGVPSGSETLTVSHTSTDTLKCDGPGGSATDTVQVNAACTPSTGAWSACDCTTEKKSQTNINALCIPYTVVEECTVSEKNGCRDFNWKEVTP